jgi:DNA-binding NarL/FixJ family response regulator
MTSLRILLVEDESIWQDILRDKINDALKGIGHPEDTIKVVNNFKEAYQYLRESDWDLLVTDIGLENSPTAVSTKLGMHLVSEASKKDIPVIVVSGTPVINTQDVSNLYENNQIRGYFKKSNIDVNRFITKVQDLLQQQLQSLPIPEKLPNILSDDTVVKRILILAANPNTTTSLRLDKEVREIDIELQRASCRSQFELKQRWAVRTQDIYQSLLDFKPQIVHFSGHGTGDDGLVLEDETGNMRLVDTEALAKLFELFARHIECVVLNACYSEIQAKAIAKHIPYVIGMNKAIGDKAAIKFATGFYCALGAGESFEFAYKLGCNVIQLEGIPEHLTPVFLEGVYKENITHH